ncbi:MAG: hypothetical protein R6U20_03220, partial [Longimonas sp.]
INIMNNNAPTKAPDKTKAPGKTKKPGKNLSGPKIGSPNFLAIFDFGPIYLAMNLNINLLFYLN